MSRFLRERLVAFAMTAVVFVVILAPELRYVPIWDARVYANCVIEAAASGITIESLSCAGHPSQGYAFLLALSQLPRPGDIALIHLTNIALGLLALGCFRLVLARVFPAREHARQLDLLTLACAVHPVLLSSLLQVNLDFGVYVFFFALLAALANGRFDWAAVAGSFLCFSKETGVLAYALTVGLYAAYEAAGNDEAVRGRRRRLLSSVGFLAIPLTLFAVHLVWWSTAHGRSAVWKQQGQAGPFNGVVFFDFVDPVFQSYAAGIFLLGFGWVLTAILGSDLVIGGVRAVRRQADRELPGTDRRLLVFLAALTVLLAWALMSFRTWSNLRYFTLLYPLLILLSFAALLRLGIPVRMRSAIIGGFVGLFLVASYRSVDPVSRAVYGTFSIGERQMYRMASLTGVFGGLGLDQLVYNLEFTGYHHAENQLFRVLKPTAQTVVATARRVRWHVWSQLDSLTYQRTMAREGVLVPRYADEIEIALLVATMPDLWFLEFSNQPRFSSTMRLLCRQYLEDRVVSVHARGHILRAHHLVRRALPAVTSCP